MKIIRKATPHMRIILALIVLIALTVPAAALAQGMGRASIEYVDYEKFPNVKVYLSYTNVQGFPIKDMQKESFTVSEEGKPVTNFQVEPINNTEQPLAYVLLMDVSDSMAMGSMPRPIETAKAAAKNFVKLMADQDQAAIVAFSGEIEQTQPLTSDKDLLGTKIDGLETHSGTALNDALVEAVKVLKNHDGRHVIVLLTDGRDTASKTYNFEQAVTEAARWSIPVYPIGFGDVDRNQLERLADLTGGAAQIKPDATTLSDDLAMVMTILREQYLVTFTSALQADGKEHELSVSIDDQGAQVQATHTFIARPSEISISLPDIQDGQKIGGKKVLKPEFTTPSTLEKVDYLLDGTILSTVISEPYEFEWDMGKVAPGKHTFEIAALDKSGNTGKLTLSLEIRPLVEVKFIEPAEGASIYGKTMVKVGIESFSKINKAVLWVDGVEMETPMTLKTEKDFECEWNSRSVAPGSHTLKVVAEDSEGNTGEAEIKVTAEANDLGMFFVIAAVAIVILVIVLSVVLRKRKQPKTGGAEKSGGAAVLRELQGLMPEHVWPLQNETRLGRKRDENDIGLKGLNASRQHALIRLTQGEYFIQSIKADNPVFVNEQPVSGQRRLVDGDLIRAGESLFTFEKKG